MLFRKQDLTGDHYNWNEDTNDQVFTGEPSRRLFDRFNGNQVLFIINLYATFSDGFTTEEARMIEEQIAYHLPPEIKSEISVFNWVRDMVRSKSTG